jgi:hypothetical protein
MHKKEETGSAADAGSSLREGETEPRQRAIDVTYKIMHILRAARHYMPVYSQQAIEDMLEEEFRK